MRMTMEIPEHPEIAWALRTGYPSWLQEDGRSCTRDIWEDAQQDAREELARFAQKQTGR